MADFAFTRHETTHTTEATKTVPLTCHGHSRPITHLSFSSLLASSGTASQYYMISACKDNNPMLRDGLTGDWIGTFIGHKGAVWSVRLSEDATIAATGSADFSAKVWDTFTGETLATLEHNHIVRAVAFPPGKEPRVLATGGMEKKLRIFDLSRVGSGVGANGTNGTGPEVPSYEIGEWVHQGSIKSIIWTRDPNVLITACDDKKVRWWDLRSRSCIAMYEVEGTIGSCELSTSSSEGTLSVASGKTAYFFSSTQPGQLIRSVTLDREVASVALNGEHGRFVTGSPSDTYIRVWDFESEGEIEMGKGHHGPVWTTAFSPDGKLYASGSEDGTIKLWKCTQGSYGLWR